MALNLPKNKKAIFKTSNPFITYNAFNDYITIKDNDNFEYGFSLYNTSRQFMCLKCPYSCSSLFDLKRHFNNLNLHKKLIVLPVNWNFFDSHKLCFDFNKYSFSFISKLSFLIINNNLTGYLLNKLNSIDISNNKMFNEIELKDDYALKFGITTLYLISEWIRERNILSSLFSIDKYSKTKLGIKEFEQKDKNYYLNELLD